MRSRRRRCWAAADRWASTGWWDCEGRGAARQQRPGGGREERSALDDDAAVLVVSQFTLYADTRKGRRSSWSAAAPGPVAEPLVLAYVEALRELGLTVQTGRFGADMSVELVNDGPVTLILEA